MADQAGLVIDGFSVATLRAPQSVAELGELVRQAARDRLALYPCGGRTMLDLGASPTREGIAVDVRGLRHVIDHPARDMTITVQAGLTVAGLQEILARETQRLPIDVPLAPHANV